MVDRRELDRQLGKHDLSRDRPVDINRAEVAMHLRTIMYLAKIA